VEHLGDRADIGLAGGLPHNPQLACAEFVADSRDPVAKPVLAHRPPGGRPCSFTAVPAGPGPSHPTHLHGPATTLRMGRIPMYTYGLNGIHGNKAICVH